MSRRFGELQALDHVDLCIRRGEMVGYVGPNGSGKTTTLRAMLGLVSLDSGELRLFGRDVRTGMAEIGPRLGVVFDQHALHAELTVRETLELYARLYEIKGDRRRRTDEVLALMGLGERADSRAKTLSKGLRQRLAFGRAIIHAPDLLVLDEPFDGIDTETLRHLRELLRRLVAEGTSVFLTSHDLHEVDQLASRVIILDRGRVVAEGTPAELKRGVAAGGGVFVVFQQAVTLAELHDALGIRAGEDLAAERPHVPLSTSRDAIELSPGGLQATIRLPQGLPADKIALRLLAAGLRVRQFQPIESTLEDAYFARLHESMSDPTAEASTEEVQ